MLNKSKPHNKPATKRKDASNNNMHRRRTPPFINSSKRKIIICLGIIAGVYIIVFTFMFVYPKLSGSIFAPKFASLDYMYTVGGLDKTYNYWAEGLQQQILGPIVTKLGYKGYEFYTIPSANGYIPDARCGGNAGDTYYFTPDRTPTTKLDTKDIILAHSGFAVFTGGPTGHKDDIRITFFPHDDFAPIKISSIGCDRPSTTYRVEFEYIYTH